MLATAGVGIGAVGASSSQLLGIALALVAAAAQAGYVLCGRHVRKKLDLVPYTTAIYLIACICLLATAIITGVPATGMSLQGIGICAALAIVCTIGGHSMQNYALKYIPAPTVSTVMLTEVITGPFLVYLFLGEIPGAASLIGGGVILLGVGWYVLYAWRSARAA